MKNIYTTPEAFGLRTVGEVELSPGSYEFDTFVVWQDVTTGALFSAHDSGCSCPMPFESYDRTNITPITRPQDLIDQLDAVKAECSYYDADWNADAVSRIDAAIGELVMKVGAVR